MLRFSAWSPNIERTPHLMLLLVLICLADSAAFAGRAFSPSVKALKLEQTYCTLGKLDVLITAQAIRIDVKKNHTVMLARAPVWNLVWYRNDTKTAVEIPLDMWAKSGTTLAPLGLVGRRPFKQVGETTVAGQRLLKLYFEEDKKVLNFWELETKFSPKQANDVLSGLYRIDPRSGTPYYFKMTWLSSDPQIKTNVQWAKNSTLFEKEEGTRLQTNSVSFVTVPIAQFEYPHNYHMVKHEEQVWLTKDSREAMDDLFNMPTLENGKSRQ